MRKGFEFSKIEKLIITGSLLVGFSVLAFQYLPKGAAPQQDSRSHAPVVGTITHQKNDTRYKSSDTFIWSPSSQSQRIQTGDSVFAGENSAAQVRLKSGGDVVVGANSLVAFNEIEKERVANFLQGNFKLSVRGQAKIAVRGKITKISGQNSEVQLFTDKDIKPIPEPKKDPIAVLEPVKTPLVSDIPPTIKAPESEPRSLIVKDFWVWLGAGVNYTANTQTVAGFSDIEYGRIKGPSTMAKAGFFTSDSFGLDLGYKTTPGEAKSSASLSVRNGSYTWQTMSAEALYRSDRDLSRNSEWMGRVGLQQHQVPFMVPESTSVITVTENSMTNVSVGFEYKRKTREKLRFEWLMRLQRPIAQSSDGGASLSISPQLAFDGSIGSAYELKDNLFVGVYWYGQYQKFDFNYKNNSGTNFSGSQSLFFSNFDLRLGWEF